MRAIITALRRSDAKQCHPVVFFFFTLDGEAVLSDTFSDLVGSVDNDSGEDEGRAVLEVIAYIGHHADDYIRDDVCYAEVVFSFPTA